MPESEQIKNSQLVGKEEKKRRLLSNWIFLQAKVLFLKLRERENSAKPIKHGNNYGRKILKETNFYNNNKNNNNNNHNFMKMLVMRMKSLVSYVFMSIIIYLRIVPSSISNIFELSKFHV